MVDNNTCNGTKVSANRSSCRRYVPVSLTEEAVLNYGALPPELNGWRYYRIEYGGHGCHCIMERPVMLPPMSDAYIFDLLFDFWQSTAHRRSKRKIMRKIIEELERGMI